MYLVENIIILQAISLSLSFDVQIEGVVRLKDTLLDSLNHQPNNAVLDLTKSINSPGRRNLQKKFPRSSIMRANSVGMNRSDDFMAFVDHIKSTGVTTLKTVAKQIFKGMKIQKDFARQVETVTNNYKISIQEYLKYVMGQKTKFTIDEEFMFLDMAETACRFLYREQRKLLNFASAAAKLINDTLPTQNSTKEKTIQPYIKPINNKDSYKEDIHRMNQIIYRQSVKTKREELRYICNKYEICRPYPAFTDYLADFIVEILKLPDEKLQTFVKILRLLGEINSEFFDAIIEKEDKELVIIPVLNDLIKNLDGLQETLLLVRGMLTQRFKIINSPNLKLKMKTQAVRIFLDIINQAYQYENDDLLAMEFDTVVTNVRSWNNGQRHFPESSVISLFNNIINILNYNLSTNAKSEIKVLIETFLRGSSRNEELSRKLFSYGSEYVKGEDIVHGIEVI